MRVWEREESGSIYERAHREEVVAALPVHMEDVVVGRRLAVLLANGVVAEGNHALREERV
jgi:hypothetical protein